MRGATAKRSTATLEHVPEAVRDPLVEGPLKFDFHANCAKPVARPEKAGSIKEALIRWLDQQL